MSAEVALSAEASPDGVAAPAALTFGTSPADEVSGPEGIEVSALGVDSMVVPLSIGFPSATLATGALGSVLLGSLISSISALQMKKPRADG